MEYKRISQEELKIKLELHQKWLNKEEGGERLDLSGYDLRGFNLEGLDLRKADFTNANLSYAILSYADLSYANLKGAILTGANLSHAILKGANFEGVILKDTDLYKTDLFYATVDNMIGLNNVGEYNRTVYYFYKDNKVICGCFDNTLEEFEKAVREKYGEKNKDYNMCLKVFKEYKE